MRSFRVVRPRTPGWRGWAVSSNASSDASPYSVVRKARSAAAASSRSRDTRRRKAAGFPLTSVHSSESSEEKSARKEGRHVQRRSRDSRRRSVRLGGRSSPGWCCGSSSISSIENTREGYGARLARERRRGWRERSAERPVELGPVGPLPKSAAHALQELQEERLDRTAQVLLGQLHGPRRVAENRARLEAGRVVEEPPAARVHEKRVALHLEKPERERALVAGRVRNRVPVQETGNGFLGPVEDHLDRVVPRGPGVSEQRGRRRLVERRERVAQPVERLAKRTPPRVGDRSAGRATAIVAPAPDAVGAAPGGVRHDPGLEAGRKPLEKLAV